jgi:hypothetical protein
MLLLLLAPLAAAEAYDSDCTPAVPVVGDLVPIPDPRFTPAGLLPAGPGLDPWLSDPTQPVAEGDRGTIWDDGVFRTARADIDDTGAHLEGRIVGGATFQVNLDLALAGGDPVVGTADFTLADGSHVTMDFDAVTFYDEQGERTPDARANPFDLPVPKDAVAVTLTFEHLAPTPADGSQLHEDIPGVSYPVQPAEPTVHFGARDPDGAMQPWLSGEVIAGDTLTVEYSPYRTYHSGHAEGHSDWGVQGEATITLADGSQETTTFEAITFQPGEDGQRLPVPNPTPITVPGDATSLELRFEHHTGRGESFSDGDRGGGWSFPVSAG